MPNQNQQLSFVTGAPSYSIATAATMPLQFVKAVSDVPDGMKVSTLPPGIKLTRNSLRKAIKRNGIAAMHWVNLPFVDALTSVSRIYKRIEIMAFNYQRQHTDAFFEAYPELLIFPDDEGTEQSSLTTSILRRDYRKYCKRLAHYYYQYIEAKKVQTGCLFNLFVLTKLNGNELWKRIATDVRWSKINTHCNLYERFPQPVGLENYLAPLMRYAVGKTTYGADVYSVPLIRTEVWGNVLQHAQDISSQLFGVGTETGKIESYQFSFDQEYSINSHAEALIKNIWRVASQYGEQAESSNTVRRPWLTPLSMPPVENGTVISAQEAGQAAVIASQNRDKMQDSDAMSGNGVQDDSLTGRLWHNYDFITSYLTIAFHDMMDPNSDKYVFAMSELKLIEQSSKLEDLLKLIRDQDNVDITSLAAHMSYRNQNQPNTATIVKWAPLIYDSNVDHSTDFFRDPSVFSDNFERYDVEDNNTTRMLEKSKEWPRLTPTLFFSESETPYAVNATAFAGIELDADGTISQATLSPTGKFASILDLATTASVNPESTKLETFGVTDEFTKSFFGVVGDAVVYEEDPNFVTVNVQRPFDNSDLGQCGFNILIGSADPNPNEWDMYFTNSSNYVKDDATTTGKTLTVSIDSSTVPSSDAFKKTGSDFNRAHCVNSDYIDYMKHVIVFVGGGIFQHPIQARGNVDCGYFRNTLKLATGGDTETLAEALARLSPSAGDSTKELAISTMLINAGAFTKDLDDPASAAVVYKMGHIADGETDITTWIFNPQYGPVFPIMQQNPFGNVAPAAPIMLSGGISAMTYIPTSDAQTPKTAAFDMTDVEDPLDVQAREYPTYDITLTPGEHLLYFLSKIVIPLYGVDEDTGSITDGGLIAEYSMSTISKWLWTTTAVQAAQFVGIHETLPFWSVNESKPAAVSLNSSSQFPENNVIAEPRRARSVKNANTSIGSFTSDQNFTPKSEYNESNGGNFSSKHRSHKTHKGKGNRFKRGKSKDTATSSPDGLRKSESAETESSLIESSQDKIPMVADYSTSSEDKKGKKMKKSQLSSDALASSNLS